MPFEMVPWVGNLKMLLDECQTVKERLEVLVLAAPWGNHWLDRVHVVGDTEATASAKGALDVYGSFADWGLLTQPLGVLADTKLLHKRLKGLVYAS